MGDKTLIEYIESLDNNSDALSNLAKELFTFARNNNVFPVERTDAAGADGEIEVDNLPYGYYLMNPRGASGAADGYATMFSLGTLSGDPGDTTITVKGVYPTIDKKIEGASASSASIGDDITFTLTSFVPDMTGYNRYQYAVNDTLSTGLDFNNDVEITINGNKLSESGYTVTPPSSDNTTMRIVFKDFKQYIDDNEIEIGSSIIITYSAKLTDEARIGIDPNTNTAKIQYSNDPTYTYTGDDPTGGNQPAGESASSETRTYTTSLTINKVDGEGNPLSGAAFRITGDGVKTVLTTGFIYEASNEGKYWKLTDGTYTTDDPNVEGMDTSKYEDINVKYNRIESQTAIEKNDNVDVEAFVDNNGNLTFAGLGAGKYTIKEITAPNGYNKCEDIIVTIGFDKNTEEFTVSTSLDDDKKAASVESNIISMDIENLSGSVLPSTGGIGTTIFYIVGAILVLGAVIAMITRRRMQNER